ncbi:MAG: DUF5685 family protein [Saprospiraceae bacterium]
MFGLMINKACNKQDAAREQYRMHYCGTCKTIGKRYGQSARLALNYDSVFLAELLTTLSKEDTNNWPESFQSFLCLTPPSWDTGAIPFSLQYAASTNVLLLALKTDDNLKDSSAPIWRIMKRWFNADFREAEKDMVKFGVNMDKIWQWIALQAHREHAAIVPDTPTEALRFFAEPTARITATIFSQGARDIGEDPEKLYQFGYQMGELIYLLDALEDEVQDARKKQFNAVQRAYSYVDKTVKKSVADHIHGLTQKIKITINQLPIPDDQKMDYRQRFSTNVMVRVSNALEDEKPYFQTLQKNVVTRLGLRSLSAKSFAQRVTRDTPAWITMPKYAFAYTAVMIAPSLPQELSHSSEHNLISNTAFLSILTGFIATILFWPRLLRLIRTYKSEFRRLKKEKKKGKKMTAGEWLLLVIAILLAGLCAIALCIGLLCKDCNDTAQDPNSDCWSSSSSSQGSSSSDNQC